MNFLTALIQSKRNGKRWQSRVLTLHQQPCKHIKSVPQMRRKGPHSSHLGDMLRELSTIKETPEPSCLTGRERDKVELQKSQVNPHLSRAWPGGMAHRASEELACAHASHVSGIHVQVVLARESLTTNTKTYNSSDVSRWCLFFCLLLLCILEESGPEEKERRDVQEHSIPPTPASLQEIMPPPPRLQACSWKMAWDGIKMKY